MSWLERSDQSRSKLEAVQKERSCLSQRKAPYRNRKRGLKEVLKEACLTLREGVAPVEGVR